MKLVSLLSRRAATYGAVPLISLAGYAGGSIRSSVPELYSPLPAVASQAIVLPHALATNGRPVYPTEMRATATAGMVNVDCVIDEAGRVMVLRVQDSTNVAFNQPTLDAVRGWTFEPGTRDGVRRAMRVTVPVEFIMER